MSRYIYNIGELFLEQMSGIYISDFIIILFISALICVIPGYLLRKKRDDGLSILFHVFLTIYYAGIILLFTIFRRGLGSRHSGIQTYLYLGVSMNSIYSKRQFLYSLMNIALFIPWGMLVSKWWKKDFYLKAVIMATLVGFLTSFGIECMQHITRTGFFELTDILTNTSGTGIGAIVGSTFFYIKKVKYNEK